MKPKRIIRAPLLAVTLTVTLVVGALAITTGPRAAGASTTGVSAVSALAAGPAGASPSFAAASAPAPFKAPPGKPSLFRIAVCQASLTVTVFAAFYGAGGATSTRALLESLLKALNGSTLSSKLPRPAQKALLAGTAAFGAIGLADCIVLLLNSARPSPCAPISNYKGHTPTVRDAHNRGGC